MAPRQHRQLWSESRLAKEQTRAIFVVAVTGIFGVIRYANIATTLYASFTVFGWLNLIDVLIVFWIGYLVIMAFAVSDDLFGISFALVARGVAYMIFILGLVTVLITCEQIGLLRLEAALGIVIGSSYAGLVGILIIFPVMLLAGFMEVRLIAMTRLDWEMLKKPPRKKNASWSFKLEDFINAR